MLALLSLNLAVGGNDLKLGGVKLTYQQKDKIQEKGLRARRIAGLWPHDFYFYQPPQPKAVVVKIYGGFQHQGYKPPDDQLLEWFFVQNNIAVLVVNLSDMNLAFNRQQIYPKNLYDKVMREIVQVRQSLLPKLLPQNLPVFLMGWSFGGILVKHTALTTDVYDGYIAISAPTRSEIDVKVNLFGFNSSLPAYLDTTDNVDQLKKPLLLIQGMNDANVYPQHTLEFYRLAQQQKREGLVQLLVNENMAHKVELNETLQQGLLDFINQTIHHQPLTSSEQVFKKYRILNFVNDSDASKEEKFLGLCWHKYLSEPSCRRLQEKGCWESCYQTLVANDQKNLIPFQRVSQDAPGYLRLPPEVREQFQKDETLVLKAADLYGNKEAFLSWFQKGTQLTRADLDRALVALEAVYMDARVLEQLTQLSRELEIG